MTTDFRLKTIAAALGFALAATATGAAAAPAEDRFAFSYRPAQFSQPAGAEAVYASLVREARDFCRVPRGSRTLWIRAEQQCRKGTVDAAVRAIARPTLTRVHTGDVGSAS